MSEEQSKRRQRPRGAKEDDTESENSGVDSRKPLPTASSDQESKVLHKRPRGASPKGMRWDALANAWVPEEGAERTMKKDVKFKRPRGASPAGKTWDYMAGEWVESAEEGDASEGNVKNTKKEMNGDKKRARNRSASPARSLEQSHEDELSREDESVFEDLEENQDGMKDGKGSEDEKEWGEKNKDMLMKLGEDIGSDVFDPVVKKVGSSDINFKRPRGKAPTGKVWDYEHGEWVDSEHAAQLPKKPVVKFKRPRGAPPTGKKWDSDVGTWITLDPLEMKARAAEKKERKKLALENAGKNPAAHKRPRGTTPTGKIWNPDTGRWCPDLESGLQTDLEPAVPFFPRPRGARKKGMTWCHKTGEWIPSQDAPPPDPDTPTLIKRPRGNAPLGKEWDAKNGRWVPKASDLEHEEPRGPYFTRPRGAAPNGKKWCYETGAWVELEADERMKRFPVDSREDGRGRMSDSIDDSHAVTAGASSASSFTGENSPSSSSIHFAETGSERNPKLSSLKDHSDLQKRFESWGEAVERGGDSEN